LYEYQQFSARLADTWRSEFLDKTQGFNQQPQTERDRSQIDFSASYKITPKVKVSLNAINLGNDANDQYQLLEERDFKKSSVGRRYTVNISARL
jgi:outer membrane receptor protein involved in Fe transport